NEQHPDVEFINGAVAGGAGSAAKDLLQSRLQAQDPPDTFQAHASAELQDYIDAAQIEDVSSLYDEFGLNDVFPADLVDRLKSEDGAIYSIPSNIHRANVVWANPAVLEANGIDPAATYADLDAWMADLDKLQAAGVTPLSVATTWTQVHLLETDRKSTRLNSSHVKISYAVFCLKKKKIIYLWHRKLGIHAR